MPAALMIDFDFFAELRADDDGMRVRGSGLEIQAVQMQDFELYAELRAADEGMPEKPVKDVELLAAADIRQKYFYQAGNNRTQAFRMWLETQNKKAQTAAAANAEKGLVVRKTFRPLLLKKAFESLNEQTPSVKKATGTDDVNPYMSGLAQLEKVF